MPPTLVGVGVGPGDPDLLTCKAVSTLRNADHVFGPTMALDAMGRAEAIVRQAVPEVAVERLVFAIAGPEDARRVAHEAAAARICGQITGARRAAFITLGDPNVYSTFHHLADLVAKQCPDLEVQTVPGIMAFQELAARAGTVVLDGTERLHLISAASGAEVLDVPLADPDAAIVIYKGGRHLPELVARLGDAGRLDDAVFGELLGLPGERVARLADIASFPATYLASVVIPPQRGR